MIKIAPSLLACDFSKLGEEAKKMKAAGADMLHIDVMDGHFVPNITLGAPIVKSLRAHCSMPFDVHLMISDPAFFIKDFDAAGASSITFHLEAVKDPAALIKQINNGGLPAAISLKPGTPAEAVFPYLDSVFMVLVMTVEPGFGGQSFMRDMLPKIAKIRTEMNRRGLDSYIQVDGGIDADTAKEAVNAGADVLVAGSYLFGSADPAKAIRELKALSRE